MDQIQKIIGLASKRHFFDKQEYMRHLFDNRIT